MLRWTHDRHRDIRRRTRFARLFARRNQDRYVMIEIASAAMPQLGSLFAAGHSTAQLALVQTSSSRLSRAGPQPKCHPAAGRVRRIPGRSPGCRRNSSSKMPIGRSPREAFSSGKTSLSQTPASGSGRRRSRGVFFWLGSHQISLSMSPI